MKRLLVLFPTSWDAPQLEACRAAWEGRYEILWGAPPDEDCRWDFDALGYIDQLAGAAAPPFDGVLTSSDYPGAAVAAGVARARGLPGPSPRAVLTAAHKHASRRVQQRAVPAATPRFALVDPRRPEAALPELAFPCFVKPVKGSFSLHARRVDSLDELLAFFAAPAIQEFARFYGAIFDRLCARYTRIATPARCFIAEELVDGLQVTVEGFAHGDRVTVLGVVDSVLHPVTRSFVRFDYPSALPPEVQRRMEAVTTRVVTALGLRDTLFNVELTYRPDTGALFVLEVNPRICGQFADLYQKVDGTHGYEVALALAAGLVPRWHRGEGRYRRAASFPLRRFEPARVERAPGPAQVAAAEALFPQTRVWVETAAGLELADFADGNDGASARYGVVNLGADSAEEMAARFAIVEERLGFRFAPLPGGAETWRQEREPCPERRPSST